MEEFVIQSRTDGLPLSVLLSPADLSCSKPRGILQIVHGMCEHKERYVEFMRYMSTRGFVCCIHDHRGHGKSVLKPRDLGYMYSGGWQGLVDDVHTINEWVRDRYPGLGCMILGHGVGSNIVRSFLKRHDDCVDSVMLCGTPSESVRVYLGRLMARTFMAVKGARYRSGMLKGLMIGGFNAPFRSEWYKNAWLCSDKKVCAAYRADNLCRFNLTASGYYNVSRLMQDSNSTRKWKKKHKDLPVMLMSGNEDQAMLSTSEFMRNVLFMRRVGYRNTKFCLLDNMRHEILNETGKEYVWMRIANWADKCGLYAKMK